MRRTIDVHQRVDVPADRAWSAIEAVEGLDRWFPVIATCVVEGAGAGARRVMTLLDGGRIVDEIVDVDPDRRVLRYDRVEAPVPLDRYLGTVQVTATGPGSCEIGWQVDLEVAPEAADAVTGFLQQAISDGVAGLAGELVPR